MRFRFRRRVTRNFRRRRKKRSCEMINRTAEPFVIEAAAGAQRTRTRESHQADCAVRAVHSAQRSRFRSGEHGKTVSAALTENEQADFGYDARSLDWWDYWINVHIPALRKWCYPLIEGRQLEPRPEALRAAYGSPLTEVEHDGRRARLRRQRPDIQSLWLFFLPDLRDISARISRRICSRAIPIR